MSQSSSHELDAARLNKSIDEPLSLVDRELLIHVKALAMANQRDALRAALSEHRANRTRRPSSGFPGKRRSEKKTGLALLAVLTAALVSAAAFAYASDAQLDLALATEVLRLHAASWAVILIASTISSVVGFAFSPIAGAILFHIDASYVHAVETLLVASIGLQTYSVLHLRQHINVRHLAPFVLGGCITIVPGSLAVTHSNPLTLVLFVGVLLVAYGSYSLCRASPSITVKHSGGDLAMGALGGLIGPIAAFPGGFVTIWCGMRGWDKIAQRATYQPYILVMQVLALIAITTLSGSQLPLDTSLALNLVPAMIGAGMGLKLFHALSEQGFRRLVAAFLVISGFVMIAKGAG